MVFSAYLPHMSIQVLGSSNSMSPGNSAKGMVAPVGSHSSSCPKLEQDTLTTNSKQTHGEEERRGRCNDQNALTMTISLRVEIKVQRNTISIKE
mgnify:CR=1 FL=1